MQLKNLSFFEKNTGWSLEGAHFDAFTLLVGVSGVGKTKILEAIETLADIAEGESFNGIKWKCIYEDELSNEIVWQGETEEMSECFDARQIPYKFPDDDKHAEFSFLNESLAINGEEIFSRTNESVTYRGNPTVKLQKTKSLFHLLQEDEVVAIKKSTPLFHSTNPRIYPVKEGIIEKHNDITTLAELKKSNLMTRSEKLFFLSERFPLAFDNLVKEFVSIFPFVEKIEFRNPVILCQAKHNPAPEMRTLHLKEHNSDCWVSSWNFSSGMQKTLSLLADITLSPGGSIFLFDEFENSFGINCIDAITEAIINAGQDNQFILTSHHPYIINKIPIEHWRLVTREKSKVFVAEVPEEFSTGSKHKAFTLLINLKQYRAGIES